MVVQASTLVEMPPLPLAPDGSVRVADGVAFFEDESGCGSVFLWGMAAWNWQEDDGVARRLAAVQLTDSKAASQRQVACAFGVNENTILRWRGQYGEAGATGLSNERPGPKAPSKLTDAKRTEIESLRRTGLSVREIAAQVEMSFNSVARSLRDGSGDDDTQSKSTDHADSTPMLQPLAVPPLRDGERVAARFGLLDEATPVICEGSSLPLAGALLILPALVATELLETASRVYGVRQRAFYGLRSLLLSIVFCCVLGEPRAEGLTRTDPVDLGRLLGLDRAPEVRTLRRRTEELAATGKSAQLIDALARHHLVAHEEAAGVLYVDGHVRAYHGGRELPKAHVARIRLAMPAELDTWVCDANGDGVLVWSADPGASLVGELRQVTTKVRQLLGDQASPTIAFDRGGWSPKLFKELTLAGFAILTYRKKPAQKEPRSAFAKHSFTDASGRIHHYLLADRRVSISYDGGRRRFACRQITRLDEATGHQTQILTTRDDSDPAAIAHMMFSRWRQENFFRTMRAHYGLDALDSYEADDDDPDRFVTNPSRHDADRVLAEARRSLQSAEAKEGRASVGGQRPSTELLAAFADAAAEVERLELVRSAIPAKVRLADVRPEAKRLIGERKRIFDAIRMATYNAESALARMLAPHYSRAEDEARTLLREAFKAPADQQVIGTELHVTIAPLSSPRRTRAIEGLCRELNATRTTYPGTELTLVYSIKGQRWSLSDDRTM
jgi:prepilin-type processing-associated H-X9-DG protein